MHKRAFLLFFLALIAYAACCISIRCFFQGTFHDIDFMERMEKTIEKVFPYKKQAREIYGASNLILSPMEISKTVKYEDGFLEPIDYVDYDYKKAVKNILDLSKVCNENGRKFAFISYPSKTNVDNTSERYGIETNEEEVRADFLSALSAGGINVLNVRSLLENDGYTNKDVFYKTDHHWKTTAGLYAARSIAEFLNETYDCGLRNNLLEPDKFSSTVFDDLWLGETGRAFSKTWVGALDDFTLIVPNYKTSFKIGNIKSEKELEGDFSLMYDPSGYSGNNDLYEYSAHYSYERTSYSGTFIHNNDISNGKKILIIKDSYSVVVIPFLSCAVSDLYVWDMRGNTSSLYEFIRNNDIDVVLLAYTDYFKEEMYDFF